MALKLLALLAFAAVIVMSAAASQRFYQAGKSYRLPNRNHYCTRAIRAYKTIVMNKKCYYAYSVCSDGHIMLLPHTRSPVRRYIRPRNLFALRGYPMIAAFWNKMNLACGGRSHNRVTYGQSTSKTIRNQIKNLVNDASFYPYTVIWATYYNIRPQRGVRSNTFQILIATNGRVTYSIFIYRNMGWDRYCKRCRRAKVGFSNGKGNGYQYRLPSSAFRHLSHATKIFRISDSHIRAVVQNTDADNLEKSLNEVMNAQTQIQKQDEGGDSSSKSIAKAKEDGDATKTEDSSDISAMEDDKDISAEDYDDPALISDDDEASQGSFDGGTAEEAMEDQEESEDGNHVHREVEASKKRSAATAGK